MHLFQAFLDLFNAKFTYHVKRIAFEPILKQFKPVSICTPYYYIISFNIILTCTPNSVTWSFPSNLPDQSSVHICHNRQAWYVLCSSFFLVTLLRTSSLFNFHSPVTSSFKSDFVTGDTKWNSVTMRRTMKLGTRKT